MKHKTPLALLGLLTLAATSAPASAAFTGLSATTNQTTLPQGGTPIWVVRLYANFDNTGDRLLGITAANLTASQALYQAPFGTNIEPTGALLPLFPNLQYDSYVTMNQTSTLDPGDDTTLEPGSAFSANGFTGGWNTTDTQPQTTGSNSYLIAQLTIDNYAPTASITSNLSVVWRPSGGTGSTTTGVSNFVVALPGPGGLAFMALAGIVGARSRRRHA